MPRTVEHIVQCHQDAAALRRAGKDIWHGGKLVIKHVLREKKPVPEIAAAIHKIVLERISVSGKAIEAFSPEYELSEIAEELQLLTKPEPGRHQEDQQDDLNVILDELFDWCDSQRVWVE